MIRRLPSSPPFPTRRSSDLLVREPAEDSLPVRLDAAVTLAPRPAQGQEQRRHQDRSEEHTSELQSLTNLVCRLLLEKKKKKISGRSSISVLAQARASHLRHP